MPRKPSPTLARMLEIRAYKAANPSATNKFLAGIFNVTLSSIPVILAPAFDELDLRPLKDPDHGTET